MHHGHGTALGGVGWRVDRLRVRFSLIDSSLSMFTFKGFLELDAAVGGGLVCSSSPHKCQEMGKAGLLSRIWNRKNAI